MNEWISVKDRLPVSGRYILNIQDKSGYTWIQMGGYCICNYWRGK